MLIKCPVCEYPYSELILPRNPFYCICTDCGHVYQKRVYDESYYHNLPCSFPEDYETHSINRGNYIVDFVQSHYNLPIKNVLDVGCGAGGVMRAIQKRLPNSECHGCTLSQQKDPKIMVMDVENDDLPIGPYDLIVMSHVLEHFFEPVKTLKKLGNILSFNGVIYIEVPSFHWAEVRIKSVFTPEHISYFTPTSLSNALILAKFNNVMIKESRYWGNIKCISQKSYGSSYSIKKVDYQQVLIYNKVVKLLYPWYKIVRKIRKIGANE